MPIIRRTRTRLFRTACDVSLVMLVVVVWTWDASCVHCVELGCKLCVLCQSVELGCNLCALSESVELGCKLCALCESVELGCKLCALCESCYSTQ
jgi:hypothetical protein